MKEAQTLLSDCLEHEECRYAYALLDVCLQKADILSQLRERYLNHDTVYLRQVAVEFIPRLLQAYAKLRDLHREQWEATMKRNGWEVLALRYGSVIGRLEDVRSALIRYVDGALETLCELDEEPLPSARKYGMQFYNVYVSPVFNL